MDLCGDSPGVQRQQADQQQHPSHLAEQLQMFGPHRSYHRRPQRPAAPTYQRHRAGRPQEASSPRPAVPGVHWEPRAGPPVAALQPPQVAALTPPLAAAAARAADSGSRLAALPYPRAQPPRPTRTLSGGRRQRAPPRSRHQPAHDRRRRARNRGQHLGDTAQPQRPRRHRTRSGRRAQAGVQRPMRSEIRSLQPWQRQGDQAGRRSGSHPGGRGCAAGGGGVCQQTWLRPARHPRGTGPSPRREPAHQQLSSVADGSFQAPRWRGAEAGPGEGWPRLGSAPRRTLA